jgi:hypothetical protein
LCTLLLVREIDPQLKRQLAEFLLACGDGFPNLNHLIVNELGKSRGFPSSVGEYLGDALAEACSSCVFFCFGAVTNAQQPRCVFRCHCLLGGIPGRW